MKFDPWCIELLRRYAVKVYGIGVNVQISLGYGCVVVEWHRDGVMLEQIIV